MGAGIGVGFADAMKLVEEDMKKAIPTKFDGLNIDVDAVDRFTSASNGKSSRSIVYEITLFASSL